MTEQPLRGWKDIGAFLGTSARTAQRWERELGLPVHRMRTTTGSVVSAYPSELHAWRAGVSAELTNDQPARPADDDQDVEDNEGPPSGIAIEPPPSAPAAPRPRRLAVPAARWIAAATSLVVLTAGAMWLRPRPHTPTALLSVSPRQSATEKRPATGPVESRPRESAGVVRDALLLRFTAGVSTVRLRVRADETATLIIPGGPELGVRASPSGSELTVELSWTSSIHGTASGLVKVASLRLVRGAPGLFGVPGAAPIEIAWENAKTKPN